MAAPISSAAPCSTTTNAVALLGFNINEAIDSSKGATQCKYDPAAATKDGPPTGDHAERRDRHRGELERDQGYPSRLPHPDPRRQGRHRSQQPLVRDHHGHQRAELRAVHRLQHQVLGRHRHQVQQRAHRCRGLPRSWHDCAEGAVRLHHRRLRAGHQQGGCAWSAAACGTTTGTVGSTTASQDASMQRGGGHRHGLQEVHHQQQQLGPADRAPPKSSTYVGNSFTVKSMQRHGGSSAPASFPSIYIGANGQIERHVRHLGRTAACRSRSAPSAAPSPRSSGGGKSSGGNYNASYDIWFAKIIAHRGQLQRRHLGLHHDLALQARQPPAHRQRRSAPRPSLGKTWDVWAGPRGNTSHGHRRRWPSGHLVRGQEHHAELLRRSEGFLRRCGDERQRRHERGSGITQAFSNSWYLTDVFAGFEIWNGGDAVGLQGEFLCEIK